MTFIEALQQLTNGKHVRRDGWVNKKHEIKLGEPQVGVAYKTTNSYEIKIPVVVAGTGLSVHITLEDIQSHDWVVLDDVQDENDFLEGMV